MQAFRDFAFAAAVRALRAACDRKLRPVIRVSARMKGRDLVLSSKGSIKAQPG